MRIALDAAQGKRVNTRESMYQSGPTRVKEIGSLIKIKYEM